MLRELIPDQWDDDYDCYIFVEHHLEELPTFVHVMPRNTDCASWAVIAYDECYVTIKLQASSGVYDVFVIVDHSIIK